MWIHMATIPETDGDRLIMSNYSANQDCKCKIMLCFGRGVVYLFPRHVIWQLRTARQKRSQA